MMTVRAKFKVNSIEKAKWSDEQVVHTIKMQPVCGGNEENKKFYQATPAGSIHIGCVNQATADSFELGGEYYVDFTAANGA